jgi:hypothetical protein
MAQDARKAELTAALARSRGQISDQVQLLGHDLDFRTRARRAFARHPVIWIGSAALVGLFFARLPLRRKQPAPSRKTAEPTIEKVEKAGLALGALKIAFDIARPALTKWATRWVAEYFAQRGSSDSRRR